MLKRSFSRVLVSLAITGCLLPTALGASTPPRRAQENSSNVSPAAAVRDSACFGAPIAKLEFPGVSPTDVPMLENLTQLHSGTTLERGPLQSAERALFATGRFAQLRVDCEGSNGGVVLSFVSTPNFFIGRVNVEGGPSRPTESQVANASKLQLGEVLTTDKLDRAIQNIQRLMQESGYYRATITHSEQQKPEIQQVEVTFHIRPGEQAHVGEITVKGAQLFSAGQVKDIAHMHEGDAVTAQTTSNAIENIRKRYQKKNRWLVQVEIASSDFNLKTNAVDYTFQIDPGPVVDIGVEGFKLSKSVLRRNVPVYEENALDEDLLNEGRRNLLSYMESRGYFEAKVDLKRESDPQNLVRVIYQITPGERHKVVKVEITGNKYFRDEDLRPGMQVQAASMLLSHGRYSESMLRSDVRDIENKYRANGFADVKVDTQVIDNYRGAHNQIAVILHVTEGPQTLVGSFQILGNDTQKTDSFPPLYTQSGQPFSDANVAQDRDILLNYYFDNGYPDASFEATAKPAPNNRMDVVFHIHEGERIYIDRVLVAGREFTRPYVIDRELQMKPGDPLNQSGMLNTQQKLYDLGIFSQVDTAVQDPEGIEPRKNVLVQVREAKRYTFNYGAGFEFQTGQPSNNEPLGAVTPLVSFDVSRLNFRGRDHTITFQSLIGGLQQRGLISYEAPQWFNNPNLKLTFTGFFDHTLDVTTFTSQRLEGTVQADEIINKFSTIDYRFNYRLVKASNIKISSEQIPLLSQPVRLGEPGFGYIRNRRDNDLETTRGSYITVDAGVASSYFGSQADFSRLITQYSTYHPFGGKRGTAHEFVFARTTRVGVENPFGNTVISAPGVTAPTNLTEIPLPERFLMGGGNSHRGFALNSAGPRDPTTGFPIGGSALLLNSFELRFPAPTLPFVQNNMSFAIFHDMGNVFTDGSHMLDSLLRWHQAKASCTQPIGTPLSIGSGAARCTYDYINHAIGVGVRYKTPVGPVRFDFGYDLNPTVFPYFVAAPNNTFNFAGTKQAGRFNVYFSIGQTF